MKPSRIILIGALLGGLLIFIFLNTGKKPELGSPKVTHRPDNTIVRDTKDDGRSIFNFFSITSSSGDPKKKPLSENDESNEESARPSNEMLSLVDRVSNVENLPRNLLFPSGISKEQIEEHTKNLKDLVFYEEEIKNGKASTSEIIRSYEIKIKILEDKRSHIRHYQDSGMDFQMSDEDKEQSDETIKLIDEKIAEYQEELSKI